MARYRRRTRKNKRKKRGGGWWGLTSDPPSRGHTRKALSAPVHIPHDTVNLITHFEQARDANYEESQSFKNERSPLTPDMRRILDQVILDDKNIESYRQRLNGLLSAGSAPENNREIAKLKKRITTMKGIIASSDQPGERANASGQLETHIARLNELIGSKSGSVQDSEIESVKQSIRDIEARYGGSPVPELVKDIQLMVTDIQRYKDGWRGKSKTKAYYNMLQSDIDYLQNLWGSYFRYENPPTGSDAKTLETYIASADTLRGLMGRGPLNSAERTALLQSAIGLNTSYSKLNIGDKYTMLSDLRSLNNNVSEIIYNRHDNDPQGGPLDRQRREDQRRRPGPDTSRMADQGGSRRKYKKNKLISKQNKKFINRTVRRRRRTRAN